MFVVYIVAVILFILILSSLLIYFLFRTSDDNDVSTLSYTPQSTNLTIIPTHKSVRIITTDSRGLYNDALLYKHIISGSKLCFIEDNDEHFMADITIYLEDPRYIDHKRFPSKEIWFMVNQELLVQPQFEHLKHIDVFLCKSMYAYNIIINHISMYRDKLYKSTSRIIYTKFSSNDIGKLAFRKNILIDNNIPSDKDVLDNNLTNHNNLTNNGENLEMNNPDNQIIDGITIVDHLQINKNYNKFIHFAGKSPFKNTSVVLNTWIENNGFPDLNYPKLIVTCKWDCYKKCSSDFKNFVEVSPGKFKHSYVQNIIWYKQLDEDKFLKYMSHGGFFLVPSICEGYGHYINEARSVGGTIITTNHAPMNELVNNNNGFLVNPYKVQPCKDIMGYDVIDGSNYADINTKELTTVIYNAMQTPQNVLMQMGYLSRILYDDDGKYFVEQMRNLLCDHTSVF